MNKQKYIIKFHTDSYSTKGISPAVISFGKPSSYDGSILYVDSEKIKSEVAVFVEICDTIKLSLSCGHLEGTLTDLNPDTDEWTLEGIHEVYKGFEHNKDFVDGKGTCHWAEWHKYANE